MFLRVKQNQTTSNYIKQKKISNKKNHIKHSSKIFLLGFMGSGKTYIGQRLAQVLGYDFLDLDAYLIENEGLTIAQIFEQFDELYFRQKESFYLKSLAERQNIVISTGGGAPCFFDNIDWMQAQGTSIYLKPSNTLLFQRLEKEALHRPLLRDISPSELMLFIQQKIAEREPFYKKANFTIEFDENNQDKLVDMIIAHC